MTKKAEVAECMCVQAHEYACVYAYIPMLCVRLYVCMCVRIYTCMRFYRLHRCMTTCEDIVRV